VEFENPALAQKKAETHMKTKLPKLMLVGMLLIQGQVLSGGQGTTTAQPKNLKATSEARLAQLVEANIIAVHAFQVLLAASSGKGDRTCFSPGSLSEDQLKALSDHQANLLKTDVKAVQAWAKGQKSTFDPGKDLQPILTSGLTVPPNAPVNVFFKYLRSQTKTSDVKIRTVASLYQTVLEVERDGERLQVEYAFYISLG